MAYVASGGMKKGVKFSLKMPDNLVTTRTFSGLNMSEAGGNTATGGASYSDAIQFFIIAITQLTQAIQPTPYIMTEQLYLWQN